MTSNWLRKHGELLLKYSEHLPDKEDTIRITFDYPDCGWMPMRFLKNGIDKGFIVLSDVYDSFVPMREWLETIATSHDQKASIINLDCEQYHIVLSYEPVWFYEGNDGSYPLDCGIFSVYDEADKDFILDAFCDTETFIRDIYQCLIHFAEEMSEKPEFVNDWVEQSFNDEWAELDEGDTAANYIFLNKVKSEKVEEYIKYMDKWHQSRM
jgi:hypothetical protein